MKKIQFLKSVRRDLKKVPRPLHKKLVEDYFLVIGQNPTLGTQLGGRLKGYWKFVIRYKGVDYRIIYQFKGTVV